MLVGLGVKVTRGVGAGVIDGGMADKAGAEYTSFTKKNTKHATTRRVTIRMILSQSGRRRLFAINQMDTGMIIKLTKNMQNNSFMT